MLEQFVKDYLLWEWPCAGAREKCQEEGEAKTKCHGLTANSHSPSPSLPVLFSSSREGTRVSKNLNQEIRKSEERLF